MNSWGIPWAYKRAVRHQRVAGFLGPPQRKLTNLYSKYTKTRWILPPGSNHSPPWTSSTTFTRLLYQTRTIFRLPPRDLLFYSSLSAMTPWGIPSGHSMLYIVGEPLLRRDAPGELVELWDIQTSTSDDDEPRQSSRMSSGFYCGYLLIIL